MQCQTSEAMKPRYQFKKPGCCCPLRPADHQNPHQYQPRANKVASQIPRRLMLCKLRACLGSAPAPQTPRLLVRSAPYPRCTWVCALRACRGALRSAPHSPLAGELRPRPFVVSSFAIFARAGGGSLPRPSICWGASPNIQGPSYLRLRTLHACWGAPPLVVKPFA